MLLTIFTLTLIAPKSVEKPDSKKRRKGYRMLELNLRRPAVNVSQDGVVRLQNDDFYRIYIGRTGKYCFY